MTKINTNKKSIIKAVNVLIVISLFAFSCEKDVIVDSQNTVDFNLPQVGYVGEQIDLTISSTEYDDIIWNISNGTTLTDPAVSYSFSKPGNYKIELTVYKNQKTAGRVSKWINVLYKDKVYSSENQFHAIRGFSSQNNSLVLEGYFKDSLEQNASYLVLDYKLNFIDTLSYTEFSKALFNNSINIENNLYAFPDGTDGIATTLGFKSTDFETGIESPINSSSQLIRYSNGYIYYHQNENSEFIADYFDETYTKVWTKQFISENSIGEQFLFNIGDKLYYVSFDNNLDKLYIENFKNISLSYSKVEYSLGLLANDRTVLFAFNNNAKSVISAGIYSQSNNTSYFFEVDANCNLKMVKSVTGKFDNKILTSLVDGSIITTFSNRLQKYSANWQLLSEKTFDSEDFGMCKVGSNLFLVFENSAEGLVLSYVDKNLEDVTFE